MFRICQGLSLFTVFTTRKVTSRVVYLVLCYYYYYYYYPLNSQHFIWF